MKSITNYLACPAALICILAAFPPAASHAGASSFELDVRELAKERPVQAEPKKKQVAPRRHTSSPRHEKPSGATEPDTAAHTRYTVKQGDHIFRILMREYNLSNDEAERLVPEVARLNRLSNIRKLSVGQVLLLPSPQSGKHRQHSTTHHSSKAVAKGKSEGKDKQAVETGSPVAHERAIQPPPPEETPVNTATETPPSAGVPVEPVVEASQPAPGLPVKVRAVTSSDPEIMVDTLLQALAIEPDKKRIVHTGGGNGSGIMSIKVDRYFEENGKRFIINCTPKDSFNYTLLRLLQQEGYAVIEADREGFRAVASRVLKQLGRPHDYVVRTIRVETGEREIGGFLVGDGITDRQLFLTAEPAE